MQLAHAWLKVNELGDLSRVQNITPAQAILLRAHFGVRIEGEARPVNPLEHLHITGETDRSSSEEYARLTRIYGAAVMKEAFPGEAPEMPKTFEAAGFEETEEKEPKKGKEQVTPELAKIPRGDNGADLATDAADKRNAELELEVLKLKVQLLQAQGGNQASPVPPPPPLVPDAPHDPVAKAVAQLQATQ